MLSVRQSRRRAYTLVELVLVVAIIAVFGAMAMPRLGSAANSNRAKVAANKIAADLKMMRLTARASSANTSTEFDVSNSRYTLTGMARTGSVDPVISLAGFPYNCTFRFAGSSATAAIVTYAPTGLPNAGLTIVVACGSATKTVVVDATTGAATVQ